MKPVATAQPEDVILLMQRTSECYEIVMERKSKKDSYQYPAEKNTYEWVQEVAKTLADIYKTPIVNLIERQQQGTRPYSLGVN